MKKLEKALENRQITYYGIPHDVGVVLDKYSIDDIYKYAKEKLEQEKIIRYFLEQLIIDYYKYEVGLNKEV